MGEKLVAIVVGLLLILYFPTPKIHAISNPDLDRAINYLIVNYNAAVGLIPETPNSNIYYLLSDNLLAYSVLKYYDQSNSTLTSIANNISSTLSHYMSRYKLPKISQYNILISNKPYFNNVLSYDVTTNGYTIKIDLNNGTAVLSPYEYADIAFLQALHAYQQNDMLKAINLFNVGANMYDGKGFNDKAFREGRSKGIYQTYKLALYYIAGYILCRQVPNNVTERIISMQAHNGGFYTGYLPNDTIPQGVTTNTETTSLVIYAYSPQIIKYYFNRKELPSTLPIELIFSIGVLIAAIGMAVYIIKRIIKKLNKEQRQH